MRPRLSWLIPGAVVAVGLFAAIDALRFSGDEPRPAEARSTEAIPTTQTEREAELEPEQAIERIGNEWARLFGAGLMCNRFMAQPACEWLLCGRVGGRPIRNCTPLSSEVQRSFAGAVVEDVVIKGQRAAARFSNGEAVRFSGSGGDWAVLRVGAGGEFFE